MQFSGTRKSRDLLKQHFKKKSNFQLIYQPVLEIVVIITYTDFVNSLSLISIYLLFRQTYKFLSNFLERKPFPQLTSFFLKIYFLFQSMKIFQAWAFEHLVKFSKLLPFFSVVRKNISFPTKILLFSNIKTPKCRFADNAQLQQGRDYGHNFTTTLMPTGVPRPPKPGPSVPHPNFF